MAIFQVGPVPASPSIFHRWMSARRTRCAGTRCRHIPAVAVLGLSLVLAAPGAARAASPESQLTWGVHISLAPTWFDPAEMSGIITPYMVYYALHDALVKPMPDKAFAPSLAESWSISDDG